MSSNGQIILIDNIRRDGGTNPRADLDMEAVRDYAAAIKDGTVFPPVRVFFDGTDYWLSSGFHRVGAHELAGLDKINADVLQGTQRDAQWDSFSANKDQGMRRQSGDVKRVLLKIFSDGEWSAKSQRAIAEHVGCGKTTVYNVIEEFRASTGNDGPRAGPVPPNKGKSINDNFPEPKTAATRSTQGAQSRADEDDGDDSSDEGSSSPGAAPQSGSSEPNSPPWKAFNEAIHEKVIGGLRNVYKELASITEYDPSIKRMRGRFAQGFSAAGTLGPLTALARAIEEALPAEACDQHPGYLNGAQVKIRNSRRSAKNVPSVPS